jgi:murein DD-endopeptidase MepM/ murein hydrolase activator NlpD
MSSSLSDLLMEHRHLYHPVVSFDPQKDKLISIDLTAANTSLTDTILEDIRLFSEWVNNQLRKANARYAIGGYDEHRTVYSKSRVFDAVDGTEPRRLHLGVDIWGKHGTAVMAPMDGIVHSFAFNNQAGDYGATIILSHRLGERSFHTLYGHLSLGSLQNLQEGQLIRKGDVFAALGIPSENGQWPPHLHFQVIENMGDRKGDYPGVCAFSQKQDWLNNSPDPEIILQLKQYL